MRHGAGGQGPPLHQLAQPGECRMMHEVLVDPDGCLPVGARLDQAFAGSKAGGGGLFEQHWLAGGKQFQRHRLVQVGWDQDMGTVDRVGRQRLGHRGEHSRHFPSLGEGAGRGLIRVDDRGELHARDALQGFCVDTRNEPGADETNSAQNCDPQN